MLQHLNTQLLNFKQCSLENFQPVNENAKKILKLSNQDCSHPGRGFCFNDHCKKQIGKEKGGGHPKIQYTVLDVRNTRQVENREC